MPFEDNELCPTCHSRVDPEEDPSKKKRKKGDLTPLSEGISVSSNTEEIPQWSDDSCLTRLGFSGDNFIGRDAVRDPHIREIQEARKQEELEVGLSGSALTTFTDIDNQQHIRKAHIIELRESTEKILEAAGRTLKDYFNLDPEENEVDPNPKDLDGENKEEWTDVERGLEYLNSIGEKTTEFEISSGTFEPSPTLPPNTHIRAIHIEDLRHPMPLGWREFWSVTDEIVIDITKDFSRKTSVNQEFFRSDLVNFPGGNPGGFISTNEYSLSVIPVGFGNQFIEFAADAVGDRTTTVIATEEGKKGFPSDKDIHPSDGGNKYLHEFVDLEDATPAYGTKIETTVTDPDTGQETTEVTYDIDRTWLLEGFTEDILTNFTGSALHTGGGQGCPFEHEVGQSSSTDSVSTAEIRIRDFADGLVKLANKDAKTIRITTTAKTNTIVSGLGATASRSSSFASFSHIWRYEQALDPNFGYPLGLLIGQPNPSPSPPYDPWESQEQIDLAAIANREITVRFNTHFKFFANFVLNGATDKRGFTDFTGINIQNYYDRAIRGEQSALDPTFGPVNEQFGTLLFGGTSSPTGGLGNIIVGPTIDDDVPVKFVAGIFLLVLRVASRPVFIKMILSDPPPNTEDEFIVESQGAFEGQEFKFVKPPPDNNPRIMTIYLGEGEGNKYDQVINIDDLLHAWRSVPNSGFGYTTHKKEGAIPEGETKPKIVENPSGTTVDFVWMRFYLSAIAEDKVKLGRVDGTGFPSCDINVTSSTAENFEADAFLEVSAMRIEGNDKKLKDLEADE